MICRQPLVFKSVDDNTLVRDRGWSGLVEVIKSRFDWHDVMIRSSLTIGCTTGVIGFLVLKSMFDHQSLR